eukprot:6186449-Pleurochrysis_carterae.AAC.2
MVNFYENVRDSGLATLSLSGQKTEQVQRSLHMSTLRTQPASFCEHDFGRLVRGPTARVTTASVTSAVRVSPRRARRAPS